MSGGVAWHRFRQLHLKANPVAPLRHLQRGLSLVAEHEQGIHRSGYD
jgi:hypothetical protein